MQFKDIVGQEQVKQRLIKSVKEGRIPHAQLLTGPEGTGKLMYKRVSAAAVGSFWSSIRVTLPLELVAPFTGFINYSSIELFLTFIVINFKI